MTIAFVGAGSYVFGPSVLQQLFVSGLNDVEVRLIDPNLDAIEPLAKAAQVEANRLGRSISFSTHANFDHALVGADAVIHSAAPGMRAQFQRNRAILSEFYPQHVVTEFGGVHGIAYSLRQIEFVRSLCVTMLRDCPSAPLLISANPLPRVGTAALRLGIQAIGFCSVAMAAYRQVGRRLFGIDSIYPFTEVSDRVKLATVGTNHLSWVVRLEDRRTGADLLPALRATARLDASSKVERYLARTGYLLAPGDEHVVDFLPIEGGEPILASSSHGSDADRAQRREAIAEVVAGTRDFASLDEHPAWEFPIAALEALHGGAPVDIITLCLANAGQVPQLPLGAFVETPVRVDTLGFHAETLDLPASVCEHNLRAVDVTEAIVDGDLERAVVLDPTIQDKALGLACLSRCLDSN